MKHISRFLSLILRHKPEVIGVELDSQGWVSVESLVQGMKMVGKRVEVQDVLDIVKDDEKQRYALKDNNNMIRASQGHSIKIDLGLAEKTPPTYLFHGTIPKLSDTIKREGLKPMNRHHVHLSDCFDTALQVGNRRKMGAVIFCIGSKEMVDDGIKFFQSENGVWLTDYVHPKYFDNKGV